MPLLPTPANRLFPGTRRVDRGHACSVCLIHSERRSTMADIMQAGPSPLELRVMRLEAMAEEQAATIALLLPIALKMAKEKEEEAMAATTAIANKMAGCCLGSGCYALPENNQTNIARMACSGCGR